MDNLNKITVESFDEFKSDLQLFINDGMFDPINCSGNDWTILHSCCFYE